MIPRLIIGGVESGVGKTTISTGLMGALRRKGLKVQPYKVGPDFIDPSYHTHATGLHSRNLDTWMLTREKLLDLFQHSASRADIAVVEGVMGLFDGLSGTEEIGSTAHVAKILRAPVILIVDAWGMARSAAAIVKGFKEMDPEVDLDGVILNRISGSKHAQWCREAIESTVGIPVVGALEDKPELALPERHLGLIPTPENPEVARRLEGVVDFVESKVDMDKVIQIARSAADLPLPEAGGEAVRPDPNVRIGVAYDEAFNFYYRDGLDQLEMLGAGIDFFSPVHDRQLPAVDGLYIGGGFPEVLSEKLEANVEMRESVRRAIEDGLPTFAECGGLMYLTRSICDFEAKPRRMVGVLDAETAMTKRLCLAYTKAVAVRANILSNPGQTVRGHEFHYSRLEGLPSDTKFAYEMERGQGIDGGMDGWIEHSALATYGHTHFSAYPDLARNFVEACARYGKR